MHAEQGSGGPGLLSAQRRQRVARETGRRAIRSKASVGADQKTDILSLVGKLCRSSAGTDLNIIRMRAEKEISLKALQLRQGSGKAENKLCQTHAPRSASSAQMRSYSASSSL